MIEQDPEIVPAYAVSEMQKWGCPSCGFRSGTTPMSQGGAAHWRCGDADCGKGCVILNDDLERIPDSWLSVQGVRTKHPREGTPARGRPDKRPEEGGDYFRPRQIGKDMVPSCFVCGADRKDTYSHNVAAFVQCKEAGERLVELFKGRARLDYRDFEPDRIQLKIGTCQDHLPELEELQRRTYVLGRLDAKHLAEVIRGEKCKIRYRVSRRPSGEYEQAFEEIFTTTDDDEMNKFMKDWSYDKFQPKIDSALVEP